MDARSFPRPTSPLAAALRCAIAALSLLGALALSPASVGGAGSAAAATAPQPVILSISVSTPRGVPLPAAGERVVVSVRVRNASRCTFLRQYSAFSSLYPLKTVPCGSGHASVAVPPIANNYKAPLHLIYAVRVRGAGTRSVQRSVTLSQAATAPRPSPSPAPPPPPPAPTSPTATLSIAPGSVPSTGGSVVLSFSSLNALSCTLSSTPALWTGANPAAVDCSGTYTVTLAPTTTEQQWTVTFAATNDAGQSASSTQTLIEQAAPIPAWAESSIWSGYVVPSSSALITAVSGQWTVPTLNCAVTPNGGASIWVGIGGYGWPTGGTSGTLLQTGVRTDCLNGVPQYAGWFEEYPSMPNTSKDFLGFPVSPGDSIQASIFQGGSGAWETKVDDLTTGLSGVMVAGEGWGVTADTGDGSFREQGSTVGLSYSGGYTAEWIVEDYSLNDSAVPFADYGSVTFTGLTTSLSPWSLTTDEGLAMAQNGVVLSTPSQPSNDGFSVSYTG